MKRTVWKSAIALLVCALFVLTGCTAAQQPVSDGSEQILAQLNEIKQQLDDTKSELASIKQEGQSGTNAAQTAAPAPADTTTPEPVIIETEVPQDAVYGVGCTVNGGASVVLDGPTEGLQIMMTSHTVNLDELIVSVNDPMEIVLAAIRRIPQNYSQQSVALRYIDVYEQAMALKHYRL